MAVEEKLGRCLEEVREAVRWPSWYQCQRNGTLLEEGKSWCWQHAPSAKAKRREAMSARWQAESERTMRPYRQAKAGAVLAQYVRSLGLFPGVELPAEVVEALTLFPEHTDAAR